jgi:ABC-type multidrug transport system ATPase subunit
VTDLTYAIDIQNLAKTYNGGFRALDGVDLKVDAGKVLLCCITAQAKLP